MSGNQGSQSLYNTLPDPQHCLRLLEVHSVPAGNDIIQCRLSTWRIDMAPSYHAISYTWGDPKSSAFVKVNGIEIRVRQNCLYVLRQVGRNKYSRYYWIDTLCINQDNNCEKGFQVAMMGDIYRTAENVLICVGRHEDDSKLLFKALKKQNDLFVRVSQSIPHNIDEYGWGRELDTQTKQALIKWKLSQRSSITARLTEALHHFRVRPYFRRVWTLQERFLAKDITVCCGNSHCTGDACRGLGISIEMKVRDTWVSTIISRLPFRLESRLRPLLARRTLVPWQSAEVIYGRNWGDIGDHFPSGSLPPFHDMVPFRDKGFLSLWPAMIKASRLKCADPRDRLYGMIDVVDWSGLQKPIPDYDCDVFDLALETLHLLALCPPESQANETGSDEPVTDGPGTGTGLPRLDRATDVADFVLEYFNLSTQSSAKYTAVIEKRSKGISADLERLDNTVVRFEDSAEWVGYELMLDTNDFEWPLATRDRPAAPKNLKFKYANGALTDAHGRLRGLLPSSTRSGDWLVTIWHSTHLRSFVIRGRPDDKYDLLGQAIGGWIRTAVMQVGPTGRFRMTFYAEDLLALAQNHEQYACLRPAATPCHSSTQSLISEELMYFSPGLSYAECIRRV